MVKMILSKGFRSVKHRIVVTTIALISAWIMPAFAELNIESSQSVMLSKDANENQYFTDTIRIMQSPKDINIFKKIFSDYDIDEYVDITNSSILQKYQDLGVIFKFSTVEGGFGGPITGPLLATAPVENKTKLTLMLPKTIETKLLSSDNLDINTYGKPIEFARLSTITQVSGAGFMDGRSGGELILVYTSGKVDITGKLGGGDDVYNFKDLLPSKGWHWILLVKKDGEYYESRVNRAEIDPIIYAF